MTVLLNPHRFADSGGGGGSWTPADLDNKIGWWDASQLTGLSDGDPISTLTDAFGLADGTAAGTERPTYKAGIKNGLAVSRWTRAAASHVEATLASVPSFPCTLWAVAKLATLGSGSGEDRFLFQTGGSSTSMALFGDDGTNEWWAYNGSDLSPAVTWDTNWHIFVVKFNSASSYLRLDQVEYTGSTGSRTASTSADIGCRYNNDDSWDGDIGEIGFVDDVLTSTELADLESYLVDKWGL